MTGLTLSLKKREQTGKAGKKAMAEDDVPGVIYGKDVASLPVMAKFNEITKLYSKAGGNHVIVVKLDDDNEHEVLFKALDRHPMSDRIRHFDMFAIKKGEKIKTEVPIEVTGESPAVRLGNVMAHILERVEVESQASKIPDHFAVDISTLTEVGDHITVADLKVPEGVEILTDADQTIVKIDEVREQEEEPVAEATEEGAEGEAEAGAEGEGGTPAEGDNAEKTEE